MPDYLAPAESVYSQASLRRVRSLGSEASRERIMLVIGPRVCDKRRCAVVGR